MAFSSLKFIFALLPILLVLYYLVPQRWKNPVLLTGSILFYGLGSWWQTGLLAVVGLVNFLFSGAFSGRRTNGAGRKVWLVLAIAANAAFLTGFKLVGVLPIGISFYTFQMIAYQVDVYRGQTPREESLLRFGTYLFFFPKLQQGPITRYDQLADGLRDHVCKAECLEEGLQTFIVGLSYKVLLADKLGGLWGQLSTIGYDSVSTPMAWLGMAAYTLQLYFDFHGYSLMAMGLGRMFGFSLPRNFLFPYCATTVGDFYRRWHATLGSWFRDYIYIPMGGSRKGTLRTIFNLFVVWLTTGLWHGLGWNYILWGLTLFFFIALEKLFLGRFLNWAKPVGHLYVLLVIPLTWMMFANTDPHEMLTYFNRLFPFCVEGVNVYAGDWLKYGSQYAPYLVTGVLFLFPQPEKFLLGERGCKPLTTVVLGALFWMCVYSIHNSAGNPFMYLQF